MYSALESRWLSIDDGDPSILAFHLTTRRIVLAVLVIHLVLLGTIGLAQLGYDIPLVRPVLAILYLTFIPGFLLLRIAGVNPDRDSALLVYTVGASLASLMAIGAIVNFGLRFAGVARPLADLPLIGSVSAVVLVLTGIYYYYRPSDNRTFRLDFVRLLSPVGLGLLLLPPLGIYGALALTRFDTNLLLLVLYVAIALTPVLILTKVIPRRLFPIAIWTVALALLLQNTLTGQFLTWGDQENEAALVLFVLQNGHWDPALPPHHANKFTMLRIVILHPIYARFSGLDIAWLFKLVHPFLFSTMPVALYLAYRRFTTAMTAFLSTFLYMSLFSFFLVLSRNTRTATALLFIALLLLALSDESLVPYRRKLLAITFAASIVVSHYGVSYIMMLGFVLILPLTIVFQKVAGKRTGRFTSPAFVILYMSVALAWYIYVSPESQSYHLLLNFFDHFITSLQGEFLTDPGSTSATTRYITEDFNSNTIRILTLYNFAIGGIIVFGLIMTIWRLYSNEATTDITPEYLAYAWTFLAIFGITFLPVERFNTARTYATSLLVFAPFFILGIKELLRVGTFGRLRLTHLPVRQVAAIGIVIYFVLNVGLVSVAVTHEYSPNVMVEKERVLTDGHPVEKEYFFKQYRTTYDVSSNAWLRSNAVSDEEVYASRWPGNPRGTLSDRQTRWTPTDPVSLQVKPVPQDIRLGPGYVYLGSFSYLGNVIKFPASHFEFKWEFTSEIESQWAHKSKVYANGGSVIYK